jgi:hypothetical protein
VERSSSFTYRRVVRLLPRLDPHRRVGPAVRIFDGATVTKLQQQPARI